jgi:RNA polymerase sigma-70 factor, ECF subfamily
MSLLRNISKLDGIRLSRDKDERIIRDDNWVRDLNTGDKKAFESIYKCYYSQLYHFLLRYTGSEAVIEDIIQQVFFKIWQNRENIEPRGTLKSYLFSAVRNQALKQIEFDKKLSRVDTEILNNRAVYQKNPEESMQLKELEEAYQTAVEKLPEKRRHIFLMHRQDNLTYKEIAAVLNISVKTVETQISRSLKFLATSLSRFI